MSGCSNNNYIEFRKDFCKSYLEVSDSLNLKDTMGSLKSLQNEKNKSEIDKMKKLLEDIKYKVPKGMERDYSMLCDGYNELNELSNMSDNWDYLSSDEKRKIYNMLLQINMRKESFNK